MVHYVYIYMYIFVTVYSLPAFHSWTYHRCIQMFHESCELPQKLSIAFSSMPPKAKVVTKYRKEKQQGYEENRGKRRSVSMAEYQLLVLGRERLQMSEEDRNILYRREEAADTEEGMRMQIEDLQSQLGRSEVMRENLRCQVLRLKLKINALFSAREENALMRSER